MIIWPSQRSRFAAFIWFLLFIFSASFAQASCPDWFDFESLSTTNPASMVQRFGGKPKEDDVCSLAVHGVWAYHRQKFDKAKKYLDKARELVENAQPAQGQGLTRNPAYYAIYLYSAKLALRSNNPLLAGGFLQQAINYRQNSEAEKLLSELSKSKNFLWKFAKFFDSIDEALIKQAHESYLVLQKIFAQIIGSALQGRAIPWPDRAVKTHLEKLSLAHLKKPARSALDIQIGLLRTITIGVESVAKREYEEACYTFKRSTKQYQKNGLELLPKSVFANLGRTWCNSIKAEKQLQASYSCLVERIYSNPCHASGCLRLHPADSISLPGLQKLASLEKALAQYWRLLCGDNPMEFNFQILGKLADKIRHNSSAVEWLKEPPDYPDLPKYSGSCWQKMGQLRNLYTHTLYSTNANTSPRSSLRRELGNISSTLLEGCVIGSSWMNQYLLSRFRNAAYHLNYERVEVAKIELARALDHFENHGLTQSSLLPFNRAYRLLSLSSQKRRSREPDSMMFCLGQIGTALRILKTVPLQNATARQIARAKRLQKQWLTELKEKLVIRPGEWPLQVYNGMSRELAKRTR